MPRNPGLFRSASLTQKLTMMLVGSSILTAAVVGIQANLIVVLHHHEHYDGKGYPDALKGEQIPLESRILSVADAFVAMTSERPYRSKLPEAIAMQRIMAASGDQFDPVVVNAFMQNASAEAMAEYESRQRTEQRVPSCSA